MQRRRSTGRPARASLVCVPGTRLLLQGSCRVWPTRNPTMQQLLQPPRELHLLCAASCDDGVGRVTGEVNFHVFFRQGTLTGTSPFPALAAEALRSQAAEGTGGCFTKQHGTTSTVSLQKPALLQAQTQLPHPRTSKIRYDIIEGNAKLTRPQHMSKRRFILPAPRLPARSGGCLALPGQSRGNTSNTETFRQLIPGAGRWTSASALLSSVISRAFQKLLRISKQKLFQV